MMGRTSHKDINMVLRCLIGFLLCIVMMGAKKSEALEFSVGGGSKSNGWSVPSDNSSNPFNQWAERTRFLIGDSLVFVYQASQDSVLYVTKEAYDSCNNESYIARYTDGHTVFRLNQSGPFHFISGVKTNCHKNEKLLVIVLADRSNKTASPSPSPPPSSPPSPSGGGATTTTPSPAPSGEESPSPPPGTVETNPTPPPRSSSPRTALVGFFGYTAAFAASSAMLVI
ncbi:hypothetical protein SAY86_011147 [Trapa natans]|uniref:Phytocyanin domain-containing protein n=1 Tax=Trapa natans TaxID=22666 RepID=A0AAN7LLN2_TRANT|nr:hypothetical protein SAY86_011147 [Trapa natans]